MSIISNIASLVILTLLELKAVSCENTTSTVVLVLQCQTLTCLNGGSFFSIQHGLECGCICDTGYEGPRCEIDRRAILMSTPPLTSITCGQYSCLNGGNYMEIFNMSECGCVCSRGYNGQHCESDMVSDPPTPQYASSYNSSTRITCGNFRCNNGGSYSSLVSGRECGCICPAGFQGKHCNINAGLVTPDTISADNLTSVCFNYPCADGQFYSFQHGRECGCVCSQKSEGLHCELSIKTRLCSSSSKGRRNSHKKTLCKNNSNSRETHHQ